MKFLIRLKIIFKMSKIGLSRLSGFFVLDAKRLSLSKGNVKLVDNLESLATKVTEMLTRRKNGRKKRKATTNLTKTPTQTVTEKMHQIVMSQMKK